MKHIFSKLLFIFCFIILSCKNNEIMLGSEIGGKDQKYSARVLSPSLSIINSADVTIDDVEYIIGINSNQEVSYVLTFSNNFIVDNLTINSKMSDIKNKTNELKYIPGWGYYVKVNSEWYAGFNFKNKPYQNSKIEWFFKYNFKKMTRIGMSNSINIDNKN